MLNRGIVATVAAVLIAAAPVHAVTPAQKCQTAKNKTAGKYAYCRQKAEAKFATTGDASARTTALQKCLDKYAAKWPGLEQKAVDAGGVCPSVGDQAGIQGAVDDHTDNIAGALAGGTLSDCPGDLATCTTDLGTCNTDLATCQATPQGQRLKTGQTTCWDSGGNVITCAGTGQDGELQKGLARAYTDNGDGTITDTKTGLMWEKLSDDGSVHDKDTNYNWANAFAVKIAALNGGGGFAGHTDWRVPNITELQSLLDYGAFNPAVSPAFNTNCSSGCTVLTCSCTDGLFTGFYWSSTTYGGSYAFYVFFTSGTTGADVDKTQLSHVRAVRDAS